MRVVWGRSPSSRAITRATFIAAALAICCNLALATPIYRQRRRAKAQHPCEMLPSTPARLPYCFFQISVCICSRLCCMASKCACGWVIKARLFFERVHNLWASQLWQSLSAKRMYTAGLSLSRCSRQVLEVFPWGQVACL